MRLLLRRAASVVFILAFGHSAVAQCAGWQATPEARMDCCQDDSCPLHDREDAGSPAPLTQAAADACCAQSPRHESSPTPAAFAATMTIAVLQPLPPLVLNPAPAIPIDAPWETPSPPTRVPKHLLLSVLLV